MAAGTNPTFTSMIQASQQPLYDAPQQEAPRYEMGQLPKEQSLSSQSVHESKEVVSSNVQHDSNGVGNYSNQKEQMKWLIVMILLITSTLLNVIILIAFLTKETSCGPPVSCPPVINTTQNIAQTACGNTTDGIILQQINNNITTLLDMVSYNTQLLDGTTKNVTTSLQHLSSTQSILENISNENKGTINDILVKVEDVLENQNTSLISSCQDMKNEHPIHINRELVYSEMGELCNSEGGWTRLAYLDMTDSTVACPPGFKLYEDSGVRACGRPDTPGGSCVSIEFPSNGISYSEVCGRVVGYQFGSPDALAHGSNNIDSYYVDGVSITQGYPRKHVWTLAAGVYSNNTIINNCPCNTPPGIAPSISMFIGNDYFCESADPTDVYESIFYPNDPLWDGEGCGSQEQDCCSANGLPWFHKTLTSTTDYLELRVCGSEPITNEDVPISFYQLYVK